MNLLRRVGDFLSGDWWKGVAVIITGLGIILGSVLTYGIFRLTESNLDLAASNLEESRQERTAQVHVMVQVYVPVIDGVPEFEGAWIARLHLVNYGPATANAFGFVVDVREIGGAPSIDVPLLYIDPGSIRLFDSSLNEMPNGLIAIAEYLPQYGSFRVQLPLLRPGERLDVVAEGLATAELVRFAKELHSEDLVAMPGSSELLWAAGAPVPANSAHSFFIDRCVSGGGWIGGQNVEGNFYPSGESERLSVNFLSLRGDPERTFDPGRRFYPTEGPEIFIQETGITISCPR